MKISPIEVSVSEVVAARADEIYLVGSVVAVPGDLVTLPVLPVSGDGLARARHDKKDAQWQSFFKGNGVTRNTIHHAKAKRDVLKGVLFYLSAAITGFFLPHLIVMIIDWISQW